MYVSGTAIGIRLDGLPDHESKCGSGSAAKGLRRVLEAGVGRLFFPWAYLQAAGEHGVRTLDTPG